MKPAPLTRAQRAAEVKRHARETHEAKLIGQLPRAQRRATVRSTDAYRRLRRRTRPLRRAFGGWPGAFRPGHASTGGRQS